MGLSTKNVYQIYFKNNFNVYYFNRYQLNLTKDFDLQLSRYKFPRPDYIVNFASFTNVEKAESLKTICYDVNVRGMRNLCNYVKKSKSILIHISTDYVYGGFDKELINENQLANPQNYYGYSKFLSEKVIINSFVPSIILRCGWLYSKYKNNFINKLINFSKENQTINVVDDEFGSPTYCDDLSVALFKIIKTDKYKYYDKCKIFNYSNMGFISRYDFAKKFFAAYDSNVKINRIKTSSYPTKVKRPKYINLSKYKFINFFKIKISNWDESLNTFLKEI